MLYYHRIYREEVLLDLIVAQILIIKIAHQDNLDKRSGKSIELTHAHRADWN